MAATLVVSIEDLIKILQDFKEKHGFTHAALGLNTMDGNFTAPTKKKSVYGMSMFLAGNIFKTPALGHIVSKPNMPCALLLVHGTQAEQLNMGSSIPPESEVPNDG